MAAAAATTAEPAPLGEAAIRQAVARIERLLHQAATPTEVDTALAIACSLERLDPGFHKLALVQAMRARVETALGPLIDGELARVLAGTESPSVAVTSLDRALVARLQDSRELSALSDRLAAEVAALGRALGAPGAALGGPIPALRLGPAGSPPRAELHGSPWSYRSPESVSEPASARSAALSFALAPLPPFAELGSILAMLGACATDGAVEWRTRALVDLERFSAPDLLGSHMWPEVVQALEVALGDDDPSLATRALALLVALFAESASSQAADVFDAVLRVCARVLGARTATASDLQVPTARSPAAMRASALVAALLDATRALPARWGLNTERWLETLALWLTLMCAGSSSPRAAAADPARALDGVDLLAVQDPSAGWLGVWLRNGTTRASVCRVLAAAPVLAALAAELSDTLGLGARVPGEPPTFGDVPVVLFTLLARPSAAVALARARHALAVLAQLSLSAHGRSTVFPLALPGGATLAAPALVELAVTVLLAAGWAGDAAAELALGAHVEALMQLAPEVTLASDRRAGTAPLVSDSVLGLLAHALARLDTLAAEPASATARLLSRWLRPLVATSSAARLLLARAAGAALLGAITVAIRAEVDRLDVRASIVTSLVELLGDAASVCPRVCAQLCAPQLANGGGSGGGSGEGAGGFAGAVGGSAGDSVGGGDGGSDSGPSVRNGGLFWRLLSLAASSGRGTALRADSAIGRAVGRVASTAAGALALAQAPDIDEPTLSQLASALLAGAGGPFGWAAWLADARLAAALAPALDAAGVACVARLVDAPDESENPAEPRADDAADMQTLWLILCAPAGPRACGELVRRLALAFEWSDDAGLDEPERRTLLRLLCGAIAVAPALQSALDTLLAGSHRAGWSAHVAAWLAENGGEVSEASVGMLRVAVLASAPWALVAEPSALAADPSSLDTTRALLAAAAAAAAEPGTVPAATGLTGVPRWGSAAVAVSLPTGWPVQADASAALARAWLEAVAVSGVEALDVAGVLASVRARAALDGFDLGTRESSACEGFWRLDAMLTALGVATNAADEPALAAASELVCRTGARVLVGWRFAVVCAICCQTGVGALGQHRVREAVSLVGALGSVALLDAAAVCEHELALCVRNALARESVPVSALCSLLWSSGLRTVGLGTLVTSAVAVGLAGDAAPRVLGVLTAVLMSAAVQAERRCGLFARLVSATPESAIPLDSRAVAVAALQLLG